MSKFIDDDEEFDVDPEGESTKLNEFVDWEEDDIDDVIVQCLFSAERYCDMNFS